MGAPIEAILRLELPLIVQLARRTMKVEDVLCLTPGSIIELPKHADEDLELLVNNKVVGAGSAVKVGENFGIRLHYIGDIRDRVKAMGPGGETDKRPAMTDDEIAESLLAGQL